LAQLWRGTYPAFFGYISVFGLVGFGIVAYAKEVQARNEAEKRAQEAQWILLKGQLNPHVFFNAMNNLTQLIQADPPLAERAAMDLSDLFRRLMSHGQSHLTPLREERLLVERYLGIEALRLGTRLQVTWDWAGPLDEVLAPPFLIQPLVENAIKHGLAPHPPGGELRLSGNITQGQVCIRVENTGSPLRPRQSGGSGLDNLEARLRLAFEEEGGLSIMSTDTFTRAELHFPVLQEAR
jgi:LytS/YehU family sensor histidine kinase